MVLWLQFTRPAGRVAELGSLDEEAVVQVVDFFARIVLITLGVVFMLSVMTGMAVIGYAVCRDFQPTISMVSTMRLSGMKW
jgi:hypothetical protein